MVKGCSETSSLFAGGVYIALYVCASAPRATSLSTRPDPGPDFSPPLHAAGRAGLQPRRNHGSPSVRPAPRAACGCKLREVRAGETFRTALQRRD